MLLAALAVATTTARASERPAHLFGPQPSWDEFRLLGEAAVVAHLIDPESARFRWTTGIWKGQYKPFLSGRLDGYIACGSVNARNRMGGYGGATAFIVVIDYGRVLIADLDTHESGMIGDACANAINRGIAPRAPAEIPPGVDRSLLPLPERTSPSAPTVTAAGVSVRAMPEGAYITAVAPGSPAATAGLKPGMVIASINAIPLTGMGDAAAKVVDAAGTTAILTLVGGMTVKLGGSK